MDLQDKLDEAERARGAAEKELALLSTKLATTAPSSVASLLDGQGKENQEMSDLERLHAAHTEKVALLSNQHHDQLEQLLAEHRQYGGMSALQMPAGFLRDATHQADTQR